MSTYKAPGALHAMALGLFLLGAVSGCAGGGKSPPQPPPAKPAGGGRVAGSTPAVGSPAAEQARAPDRQPVLDPSEEITAEELATIPEPVPTSSGGERPRQPRSPLPVAEKGPEVGSERAESGIRALESNPGSQASLWRVQVFVTQDRDLADRMAMEAQERLKVRAHIAYEAPNYKVRLGDYGSEDEARPLRERAVRSGFPGAFRVRCAPESTDDIN